ncbi:MAG: hypothetical protein LBP36_01360 [Oscillospiraceae bacterium]|nr:hypothetical protein [Oscillospiraceae bacterium]
MTVTMPSLVFVCILMTVFLLMINIFQSLEIHFMKVELRRSLKMLKSCKSSEEKLKAEEQIKEMIKMIE